MIKGLRPHNSKLMTAFVILFIIEFCSFAGYFGGFLDEEGRLDWLTFHWDIATLVYTVAMWCSWWLILIFLKRSQEDVRMKIGASIFASLPVLFFGLLFFRALQT